MCAPRDPDQLIPYVLDEFQRPEVVLFVENLGTALVGNCPACGQDVIHGAVADEPVPGFGYGRRLPHCCGRVLGASYRLVPTGWSVVGWTTAEALHQTPEGLVR
jgi:hypothetical protein